MIAVRDGSLVGTSVLLRLHLRRDRWIIAAWSLGALLLYWSQAVSVDGLYATQAEFDRAAASMETNAAFIAMAGPPRVLNTVGGQVAWQASAFGAVVAGLMSMVLAVRHTRAEEESGREELLRSGVLGRDASTAAAVLVVLVANLVLGVGIAASLVAYGLPVAGSLSLAVAASFAGLLFGAVALVAAQVFDAARPAYGATGAVIGAAYVLRAAGDVMANGLSWLSPIGWGQAMRAYADERWWPALLSVGGLLALLGLAAALQRRRDVGAGLRATTAGPADGSIGVLGLSWRLHRGSLVGWSVAMAFVGVAYGSLGSDVEDLLGDSDLSEALLAPGAASVTDAFYATAVVMLALITSAYGIAAALRARAEESVGRVEGLLAGPLSRRTWLLGHAAIAAAGSLVVLASAGLGTGISLAVAADDAGEVLRMLGATLAYAPAVLVLVSLTVLGHAIAPRAASLGWVALLACVVVMLFADLWQLPQAVRDLSPFEVLATVPVEQVAIAPLVTLSAMAVGIVGLAVWRFEGRDLATV